MAESESSPGKSPDWVQVLDLEFNRGLQALAEHLHKAWGLPGSVEDLLKETGPENSRLLSTEDSMAEIGVSVPEAQRR